MLRSPYGLRPGLHFGPSEGQNVAMRLKHLHRRAASAVGLLVVGAYAGIEVTLDRLGYVTTVFPFLPLAWQQKLVSDPVVIWGAGGCFLIAVILLASVAWKVANIADTAKRSSEKAWEFQGDFATMRDNYQTLVDELRALRTHQESLAAEIRSKYAEIEEVRIEFNMLRENAVTKREFGDAIAEAATGLRGDAEGAAMNVVQNDQYALHGGLKALQREVARIDDALRGAGIK